MIAIVNILLINKKNNSTISHLSSIIVMLTWPPATSRWDRDFKALTCHPFTASLSSRLKWNITMLLSTLIISIDK